LVTSRVFLQLRNALHTRCSLILEVLRLRTSDWRRIANRYTNASAVVLTDRSEIPQRKLMSGCFYSLCRLLQLRHISSAAKHRATTCLPWRLKTNCVPNCMDMDTCSPSAREGGAPNG
jgi:hypothetical protein